MPGFDGTGPERKGARTGRQMGRCNPENETDLKDTPRRRARGRKFNLRFRNQSDSPGNREGNRRKGRW
jgi:hypothetical protein